MSNTSNNNPGSAAFTPGPWAVVPASPDAGTHPNHAHRFVATANWTADDGDFGVTGEIIAKLTDSQAIAANARLIASSPSLHAIAEGVLTALSYPRGSEAQVRCLEEVGQDARHILAKIGGAQ